MYGVFSPQKCWIMGRIFWGPPKKTIPSPDSSHRDCNESTARVSRSSELDTMGNSNPPQKVMCHESSRVVTSHETWETMQSYTRISIDFSLQSRFPQISTDFHWTHWTNNVSFSRVTPGFFQLLQGHFHVVLLRGPSRDGQELRQRGTQIPVRRLEAPIPTQSIQSKIAKIPQKSIQKSIQNAMEKNKHKSRTQFQHFSFVSIQNPSKVVNTISTLQFTIWPPFDHPIQSTSHLWKRHISRGSSGIHQLCRKILWIL